MGSSTVNISGGQVASYIIASDASTVNFIAQDFSFGSGLWLDGDRVMGTGSLSGTWLDGASWETWIVRNETGANILVGPGPVAGPNNVVPEPMSVLMAMQGVGMLVLFRKRFKSLLSR